MVSSAFDPLLNQVKIDTSIFFMRAHPSTPPARSPFHIYQNMSRRFAREWNSKPASFVCAWLGSTNLRFRLPACQLANITNPRMRTHGIGAMFISITTFTWVNSSITEYFTSTPNTRILVAQNVFVQAPLRLVRPIRPILPCYCFIGVTLLSHRLGTNQLQDSIPTNYREPAWLAI